MAYKPFDLSGKVALVTGGNGGIGLGMADAMAQAQLKAHGVKVYARKVNVANEQEVVDGIGETVRRWGASMLCSPMPASASARRRSSR